MFSARVSASIGNVFRNSVEVRRSLTGIHQFREIDIFHTQNCELNWCEHNKNGDLMHLAIEASIDDLLIQIQFVAHNRVHYPQKTHQKPSIRSLAKANTARKRRTFGHRHGHCLSRVAASRHCVRVCLHSLSNKQICLCARCRLFAKMCIVSDCAVNFS